MRDNGLYVTILNNGERDICNVTYLKSIPKIKKAFNIQYANTYATLNIVKVENGVETIIYVKKFDPLRNTNWATTNRPTEAGWNDLASFEPAEVENQPAEAEVENQPAEAEVENQPADEPAEEYYKKYLCIVSEIQNQDNEYFRKYKLFDVSKEVNNDNIKKFADTYMSGVMGEAYIIEKTGTFYWTLSQKKYKIKGRTNWVKEDKNRTCKAFVDLFRKKKTYTYNTKDVYRWIEEDINSTCKACVELFNK